MQFLSNMNFLALVFLGLATQFMNVTSQIHPVFRCNSVERPVPICRRARSLKLHRSPVYVARVGPFNAGGYTPLNFQCGGRSMFGYPADSAACCDRYVDYKISKTTGPRLISATVFDKHCSRIGF